MVYGVIGVQRLDYFTTLLVKSLADQTSVMRRTNPKPDILHYMRNSVTAHRLSILCIQIFGSTSST